MDNTCHLGGCRANDLQQRKPLLHTGRRPVVEEHHKFIGWNPSRWLYPPSQRLYCNQRPRHWGLLRFRPQPGTRTHHLVPAPANYTYAAAQAFTSYGINKARSWSIGSTVPFDPQDSTTIDYIGSAESQYREEVSYFGAVPTLVTFKLRLHGAWNDGGRFRLAIGGLTYDPDGDPDTGHRYSAHTVYTNCPPMSQCISQDGYHPFFNGSLFYVAGNDAANTNGSVDQFINYTMLLHGGINPFEVSLRTYASSNEIGRAHV